MSYIQLNTVTKVSTTKQAILSEEQVMEACVMYMQSKAKDQFGPDTVVTFDITSAGLFRNAYVIYTTLKETAEPSHV